MNIILFGPPGSGKGTQAEKLSKEFNLLKVSSGDLLRNEITKNNTLGDKIKKIVNSGLLVPDDIINNLMENILSQEQYFDRIIFDGYPRTINQLKNLEALIKKFNQKISCILSLKLNKEKIIKRIMGRQICSKCGLTFNEFFNPPQKSDYDCGLKFLEKRSDDQKENIKTRYDAYLKDTVPIINFYKERSLVHEINGEGEILSIYEEIRSIITCVKA